MTKAEIVKDIAARTGVAPEDILQVVEAFMTSVKKSLGDGEQVFLRGFGTFGYKVRKEKVARNITAKTSVIVPEHTIPYFKPCPELEELVKDVKPAK